MCSTYAIEHLLTYNRSKSYSLCFKPKHIKFYAPCFYLKMLEIPKVNQCNYLGIMTRYMLYSGIFPEQLKVSKIIPLHKANDKLLLTNYRPIALLIAFYI